MRLLPPRKSSSDLLGFLALLAAKLVLGATALVLALAPVVSAIRAATAPETPTAPRPNPFASSELKGWPVLDVAYFEDLEFPGLSRAEVALAYDRAAASWSARSGVRLFRVAEAADANVVAGLATIDGPGDVLARSQMPGVAGPRTIYQDFDRSESWGSAEKPVELLAACIAHELGHALGLDHSDDPADLMYPLLGVERLAPSYQDGREALYRYGPPAISPGNP